MSTGKQDICQGFGDRLRKLRTAMGLGGLLSISAARRYRAVRRAIEMGQQAADDQTIVVFTLLVLATVAALIIYILESS
jgi:uncharacterized membrane protein YidH (DUF202 family)